MTTQEEKELEEMMRNRVLYIGEEVPETLVHDLRPKFILLGTPAELLNELEALLKSHDAEIMRKIEELPVIRDMYVVRFQQEVLALFNPKGN